MAKKCSMCGASLKIDAKECEYCGTNIYEAEKDKYVKENYTTDNSNTNTTDDLANTLNEMQENLSKHFSRYKNPRKPFNLLLFLILFFIMPPFAIIYITYFFVVNSNTNTK